MVVYQIDKILEDVRVSLDMNQNSDTLIGINDEGTLSINEIIQSKIVEAVKRVHINAPSHLLDFGNHFANSITWNTNGKSGWMILPDDFMRLITFEMSDWDQPCFEAISTDDIKYKMVRSRFPVMGTPQKPIVAISVSPNGKILEFYSCKDDTATVNKAVYLPYPEIDEFDSIKISQRCYDSAIYTIAALVLAALGENEKSAQFNELAKTNLI